MALTPGTRLGVYEVTAQIGAGRHGEVCRARDWSPKGRRIAFASDRNGRSSVYVKPIDGGDEELLLRRV